MKKFDFRKTFINGLFLALPVLAILYLGFRILLIIEKMIAPFAEKVGVQHLFGELTLTVFALVFLLILFFFLGVLLHINVLRNLNTQVESIAYKLVPQLYKLKSLTTDGDENAFRSGWKPVLLQEDDGWVPAYITEENEKWISVFLPESPDGSSGPIKMLKSETALYKTIDGLKLHAIIHQYGKGMIELDSQ